MNLNNEETEQYESPYCKECDACGHEGCCSPLRCKFKGNCDYGESYLLDLKCGYQSWEIFYNTVYQNLPDEFKKQVDDISERMVEEWYSKRFKSEETKE